MHVCYMRVYVCAYLYTQTITPALVNRPWAVPSEVLKTTVILSVREEGLLNFRKVRSTNPSPSLRVYDTGSNPIGITTIRVHCVHLWEREGDGKEERKRQREKKMKERRE